MGLAIFLSLGKFIWKLNLITSLNREHKIRARLVLMIDFGTFLVL